MLASTLIVLRRALRRALLASYSLTKCFRNTA
jgi:hypothetical protein